MHTLLQIIIFLLTFHYLLLKSVMSDIYIVIFNLFQMYTLILFLNFLKKSYNFDLFSEKSRMFAEI